MRRLILGACLCGLVPLAGAESPEVISSRGLVTTPAPPAQAGQNLPVMIVAPAPSLMAVRAIENPSEVAALKERLGRLETQLKNQGLLDMLNQMQEMRAEQAKLRGQLEEMVHLQKLADKRQKDLFADLDERQAQLKESLTGLDARVVQLASQPASAARDPVRLQPSQSLVASVQAPDAGGEAKAYEAALNQFKLGDYAAAVEAFQDFIKLYPDGTFASNGHYWLGLSYFSLGDYKHAAASQQRLLREHGQSHKAPDAMVSLARAQVQLGETETARKTLEQVLEKYPATRAAEAARKMLDLMK